MTEQRGSIPRLGPRLGKVSTSELSRSPKKVLERVARGQRLIVCRHENPVATLQPLDGMVLQPFSGDVEDVYGRPLDPLAATTDALDDAQRELLRSGISLGRIIPGRLGNEFDYRDLVKAMEEMGLLGLAKRESRGWELTGRGMMLRDALLHQEGRTGGIYESGGG